MPACTRLDESVAHVFSLASILNSRSVEQNSQLLLSLTKSKESCTAMRQSNCMSVLTRIIYDEWTELYDWFDVYKRQQTNFRFDAEKLVEILNRRLHARKTSTKAIRNLILNTTSLDSTKTGENVKLILTSRKEAKIFEAIAVISSFNDAFFSCIFKRIGDESFTLSLEETLFSALKLNELREIISELVKRTFDDAQRGILVEFGAVSAIAELLEIFWQFLGYFSVSDSNDPLYGDMINKITIEALKILHNLTFLNAIMRKSACSRRYMLASIFNCLSKCKESIKSQNRHVTSDLLIVICLFVRNLCSDEQTWVMSPHFLFKKLNAFALVMI